MEPKRPEWRQLWPPNETCVLLQNISRSRPSKDIEIKDASNCSERQALLCEDDVHAVAVEKQHPSSRPICVKNDASGEGGGRPSFSFLYS